MRYIYNEPNWPSFTWDKVRVLESLSKTKYAQGLLLGKARALGFGYQEEATLNTIIEDVIKSSEIEGEILNKEQVRSSIAKRLGINTAGSIYVERNVEGVVEMMLDATQNHDKIFTIDRLFSWQAAIFPTGFSGMHKIIAGNFRDDAKGAMQVISGAVGREKVHYEAPPASAVLKEIADFIHFLNKEPEIDGLLVAAIAHLWFVTIHPFEDGNGRIARALTDMLLAKAEKSSQRFYSMSAQIKLERKQYYDILEVTQKGSLDITNWLIWFLECLYSAINNSENTLKRVFSKAVFWQTHENTSLNERQKKILNMLLDGFKGNLTSSKWATICKCSQDSANRDITDLLIKNILLKVGDGRSTHYIVSKLS